MQLDMGDYEPLNDGEKSLIHDGQWINAIKEYRVRTGATLILAKAVTDKFRK